MAQENAARFFHAVQQAQATEQRQAVLNDPENFLRLAAESGFSFTVEDLSSQLSQLSDEQIAAIFNPGISPRRHLTPR